MVNPKVTPKKFNSPAALAAAGFGVPDKIDVEAEMAAMEEAGFVSGEPEQEAGPGQEGQEEIPALSSDPQKRLEEVAALIKKYDANAPNLQQLAAWKQNFGSVFVVEIYDVIYCYRYIRRQEWIKLLTSLAEDVREDQVEDMIVEKCLLYPNYTPVQKASLPAGAIPTLAAQIRTCSLFIEPQVLAARTIKL